MRGSPLFALILALAAAPAAAHAQTPAGAFFTSLTRLCGQTFSGTVVESDATADAAMREATLTMTVASCAADEIRIPFHVGADHSRTWVVTRLPGDRLRLKHDHRHTDGTQDEVSQYGGDTTGPGAADLQRFPADAQSIALFTRTGRAVSNTNVWSLGLTPQVFTYELARPGRLFRVAFDLKSPVP
ncbi:hypothetical protein [Phenylobacterium sp.]|uniref:hypothetical protein n=1 Tax=Phenylobacterium sp. TaxID=1871053 RepID=UPI0030F37DCC